MPVIAKYGAKNSIRIPYFILADVNHESREEKQSLASKKAAEKKKHQNHVVDGAFSYPTPKTSKVNM